MMRLLCVVGGEGGRRVEWIIAKICDINLFFFFDVYFFFECCITTHVVLDDIPIMNYVNFDLLVSPP